MDLKSTLSEVREEIQRLQKLEQALVEASGGGPVTRGVRTTSAGSDVIRWSAKKRWALKKGDKAALKEIEKNLALAKAALDADKATRKRR